MKHSESGSALIYIIIAIGLFASLSYVVAQQSRVGAGLLTQEQASLAASEIIEYGSSLSNAVQKLILRGCDDTAISFANPIFGGYTNGTDTICQVFHPEGGAINMQTFDEYSGLAEPVIFTGATQVQNVETSAGELMLLVGDIPLNVCEELNDKLSKTNPPANMTATTTKFTGTYANGTTLNSSGETEGCYDSGGAGSYYYFQVLLRR